MSIGGRNAFMIATGDGKKFGFVGSLGDGPLYY